MTAPDQVLTDLIAADLNSHTWGNEYENAAHEEHSFDGGCKICRKAIGAIANRVALVVEQHTNRRTAENGVERYLRSELDSAITDAEEWKARAEKAEATIARVEKLQGDLFQQGGNLIAQWGAARLIRAALQEEFVRAALEGEQQ